MTNLMIVEDDAVTRESLIQYVDAYPNLELTAAFESAEEGIAYARVHSDSIDVLLLDIGLPGISGLDSIGQFKDINAGLDIIMFTTYEEEDKIFTALCAGACSYISKRTPLKTIMESIVTVHQGGSYMSPSIARKIANHFLPKPKVDSGLSKRQKEIVRALVEGLSYKMIASKLNISLDTVRSHIKNIYKTLQVNSSIEVVNKYNSGQI